MSDDSANDSDCWVWRCRRDCRTVADGWWPYGLRTAPAHGALLEGVHPVAADLISETGFEQIPQKADALVYMASANERTEAGYRQAYVDGLARMLATEVGQSPRVSYSCLRRLSTGSRTGNG